MTPPLQAGAAVPAQPDALRLAEALEGNAKAPWTRDDVAAELRRLHAQVAALKAAPPDVPPGWLACDLVKPRALDYPLSDFHRAPADGPLNATWRDKPHRIVYDLIAAVRYYAAAAQGAAERAVPAGWRIEREPRNVLALYQSGTARPHRFEPGEYVHSFLLALLGGCPECGGRLEHEDGEPWSGPSIGCVECGEVLPAPVSQAAPAAPSQQEANMAAPAQDERGPTYLCQAWGETDLPAAAIVHGLDDVRAFLIEQWLGDADAMDGAGEKTLPRVMAEMQEDWDREGQSWEWRAEFEIGGISVQRVDDVGAARAAAPVAPAPAALSGISEIYRALYGASTFVGCLSEARPYFKGRPGDWLCINYNSFKEVMDARLALRRLAELAEAAPQPATADARITAIEQAIRDYHYALDMRQHGGNAERNAFAAIRGILGLHWVQGKEAADRAAQKDKP